jgi:ribosome-associated toxin RatA of RatAB toxin-antitoxin module
LFHNPGGAGSRVCYHSTASVIQMLQTVSRSALVPYAPSEMFALVADIEKYPGFLPWCRNARVRVPGEDTVEASLEIGRGPIRKTFTTRNVMTRNRRIDIGLIDGPFKRLQGCWKFIALDGGAGCRIVLDLEYELSNAVLRRTLGPLFREITNSMVDAFCRRAEELYE